MADIVLIRVDSRKIGLTEYDFAARQMPGPTSGATSDACMDGIECIKWLRASDYEGIILILTAYDDEHYD